jgi:hypothetical protein
MKKIEYILRSFLSALGVLAYIALVALLMFNGQTIFGDGKNIIIPIFMLTLFVVSATITGSLVLGKPILLFLENFKKEALILFFSTLGWLVVFLVSIVITLLIIK